MAEPYRLAWGEGRMIEVYGLPEGLTDDQVCEMLADAFAWAIAERDKQGAAWASLANIH